MSLSELSGYALVAVAGIGYWLYHNWAKVRGVASVAVQPSVAVEDYPDQWLSTLLALTRDLEARGDDCCVPLVRELMWRMMGGAPNDVPASKAGKK
jgi:hypothetical protein